MDEDLTAPSGGFHQDTRDFIIPKSIDELRPASNPQISYKGRVIPGKAPKENHLSSLIFLKTDQIHFS